MLEHLNEDLSAADSGTGEFACAVKMGSHGACKRSLHTAPDGVDKTPVCLMHSKDPAKLDGSLCEKTLAEFEHILEEAGAGDAHFESFVLPGIDLGYRVIQSQCWFDQVTFTAEAKFLYTDFANNVYFNQTTFMVTGVFTECVFQRKATLNGTKFIKGANFTGTKFTGKAVLNNSTFGKMNSDESALFRKAIFTSDASFLKTKFLGEADFRDVVFAAGGWFRYIEFASRTEGKPSAVFARAFFADPRRIIFDGGDLSRVSLHGCDVSQIRFSTSVKWGKEGIHGKRGGVVVEEALLLEREKPRLVETGLDHNAVAHIYQQLKKSYDDRLDYWTANKFHYGEMEMLRLAGPAEAKGLLKLWGRLSPQIGLVAWYRYASDYGNSYIKPILWLLATLVLFAGLYPLTGLKYSGQNCRETYTSTWSAVKTPKEKLQAELSLVGRSLLAAVDVAGFQKSPEYVPAYPWGRVLGIAETVLTSTLFALFLLAIRRQFRR